MEMRRERDMTQQMRVCQGKGDMVKQQQQQQQHGLQWGPSSSMYIPM